MSLVTPDFGLLFWMLITFSLLLIILKKYAWKPILKSLDQRGLSIENALKSAEAAKIEMKKLQAGNQQIMKEAMAQRDKIVKEAAVEKDSIIRQAKVQASEEAAKILQNAMNAIEQEKRAAVSEIHDLIATFSVEIAGKLLEQKLDSSDAQNAVIERYLKEINVN